MIARARLRRPGRGLIAALIALVLLLGVGTFFLTRGDSTDVKRTDQVLPTSGARIDTSWFSGASASGKRPVVLLGHGFGGSKHDMTGEAHTLVAAGYDVLTWSARGFGRSTGRIGLNSPTSEVADVSKLIDWVAKQPGVQLDSAGDPRVGMAGASYGGAIALLAAAYDKRVDAIAPQIAYWNLAEALVPNGVYKKLWTGVFFSSGGGCAKFEQQLCAAYTRIAESGKASAQDLAVLTARSPATVGDHIKVPTLFFQGQSDSLFPLGQADAAVKQIKANGAPVDLDWIAGGHDGGNPEAERISKRTTAWFDRYLKRETGIATGTAFRVTRTAGVNTEDGSALLVGADGKSYPGLLGNSSQKFTLNGPAQSFTNPPGGQPADVTAIPGTGALSNAASFGFDLSLNFPGQSAWFQTAPLTEAVRLTGTPKVLLKVASPTGEAVLFAKLYDVGTGRSQPVLPSRLTTPIRVATPGGKETEVEVTLPAVDHNFARGNRMRLVVSSTDMGYATPAKATTYRVAVAGQLTIPQVTGLKTKPDPLPTWVWLLPLLAVIGAAALLLTRPRRVTREFDPDLADVPLQISGLTKVYEGTDRRSVDDLSFTVERGQVLGLLGPNGAGKTSSLRMLMGLTLPDAGVIRVFGHHVEPGAEVLGRIGSFVEGPGLLPHLSGRQNLDLYWRATGRPASESHVEEALEIAALTDEALDRPTRTYSQGMRQRLAIAQAMLGLPDILVLDEPTNGLDPGQIREMREVMSAYAAGGRTVIVSSHLLGEVQLFCTHLVVMNKGRLVRAGSVKELVGDGRLEEIFLRMVAEGAAE
ncbi:alpha/beta fold hydrolase [Yimella sp. cx-573]|nr:alpha/beta fold hydrolase [Yimella sp. cx-573]